MNKIEIKSAVKALAEKFHVYDHAPFEGRKTFSHTFNGRTVTLTLEKDGKTEVRTKTLADSKILSKEEIENLFGIKR